jgi:hypothetical protein
MVRGTHAGLPRHAYSSGAGQAGRAGTAQPVTVNDLVRSAAELSPA